MLKLLWLYLAIARHSFFCWLTELRIARAVANSERLRIRNMELREEIIRNGGARWLVEFEDACAKLDEEERRAA